MKHCWSQVQQVKGERSKKWAPYHHMEQRGEPCELLVISRQSTPRLMHLANTYPLGGYLGPQNTSEKLQDRFTWPSMNAEILAFCRACEKCQQMSLQKPDPTSLIQLPINGVPFERICIHLAKSAWGPEYILVIMDYATHYPEAVPLQKITSQNIARELFSWVEIPRNSTLHVQTNSGSVSSLAD